MENVLARFKLALNRNGDLQINFQNIYQSSENMAVAIGVAMFIVFHFGILYLFGLA